MAQRILAVEDQAEIAGYLRRGLTMEGYQVDVASDGPSGLVAVHERPPDFAILDVMLPGLDGLAVTERLRAALDIPILMLTAKGDVADRLAGLEHGADHYQVKPFAFEELLAPIKALLRRQQRAAAPDILRVGPISMNVNRYYDAAI